MHVDGDEKKTPEKTAPFKSKVWDHANRAIILVQKVVHGKAPQYLKDLMIPSERLHVHGNKQLLLRKRTDIFKTSFSFSGSLAWNSLAHHLRYPMELKTFKRKAFQATWMLLLLLFLARQTAWHKMYRILLFSLPCSCKVLYICIS